MYWLGFYSGWRIYEFGGSIEFVSDAGQQKSELAAGKCCEGRQMARDRSVGASAMTWMTGIRLPTASVVELCEMLGNCEQ